MSTIGASSSDDSPAQVGSQNTNATAGMAGSVLLVALPSRLRPPESDAIKKTQRTFLTFPYGVLTIASYLGRFAAALSKVEILDLNLPGDDQPEALLARQLAAMSPDIVGFWMSYDVSYLWLRSMATAVRSHDPM